MLDCLKITGDVSIERCSAVKNGNVHILIMGPTGAGKSTFIEALAGEGHSLAISKDQLAGFTQDVSAYNLTNGMFDCYTGSVTPICVVDTPGFSDGRISEMEVLNKVKKWMAKYSINFIDFILYLCPITDTRVPGSKRRTIKMLQLLLEDQNAKRVTIATTMWDSIPTGNPQSTERAEARFAQLQADIWKDTIQRGAQVVKFRNNQESALDALKTTLQSLPGWFALHLTRSTANTACASLLYQDLLDRISTTRQAKHTLRTEKLHLLASPNADLEAYITPKLVEVEHDLSRFVSQLIDHGPPPPGFEGIRQRVVSQHLCDYIEAAREDISAIQSARRGLGPCDWRRSAVLKWRYQDAEARLCELSVYLDSEGKQVEFLESDCFGKVLETLRPKVKPALTLMDRLKDGLKKEVVALA